MREWEDYRNTVYRYIPLNKQMVYHLDSDPHFFYRQEEDDRRRDDDRSRYETEQRQHEGRRNEEVRRIKDEVESSGTVKQERENSREGDGETKHISIVKEEKEKTSSHEKKKKKSDRLEPKIII